MDAQQHDKSNMDTNEILVIRRLNDRLEDQCVEMELETLIRNLSIFEYCDDGNTFNFDGWSNQWTIEKGYICSGGSPTTIDIWIENQFMPTATLKVMSNNDLLITFNDTIANVAITDNDLYISIYGPLSSYSFSWTATFQTSTTIYVNMNIISEITGNGEKVYIDFPFTNNLLSIYSHK